MPVATTRPARGRAATIETTAIPPVSKAKALEDIVGWFKGDELVAMIKRKERVKAAVAILATFAAHDTFATMNKIRFGELAYNFLLAPLDVQQQFTSQMAEIQGVEAPVYPGLSGAKKQGRVESGRNQFSLVVYTDARMHEIVPGSRDSRAGKNISDSIRKYKIDAGLIQPRTRKLDQTAVIPKTGSGMFVRLLEVAENDELNPADFDSSAGFLDELARRAGFDDVTIARWHRNLETQRKALEEVPVEEEPEVIPSRRKAA